MLIYCRACTRTYDGNAQCCMGMDHVDVTIYEHIDEIRRVINPNEELGMRLDMVEKDVMRLREKEDMYDRLSQEVDKLTTQNAHLQGLVDKKSR